MSADNYLLIREQDGKYWLSDESASADKPDPINKAKHKSFTSLVDAVLAAQELMQDPYYIVEYGLSVAVQQEDCEHCKGTGIKDRAPSNTIRSI